MRSTLPPSPAPPRTLAMKNPERPRLQTETLPRHARMARGQAERLAPWRAVATKIQRQPFAPFAVRSFRLPGRPCTHWKAHDQIQYSAFDTRSESQQARSRITNSEPHHRVRSSGGLLVLTFHKTVTATPCE